jgi:two-component sensor histidine kinase
MLAIQSEYRGDERFKEVFEDIQNRIWSMALVHEGLYGSDNLSEINASRYFTRLLAGLSSAYWNTRQRVAVKIDVEDISLELDTAVPCGLIVSELFTNALKHAFPDERHGEIRVSLGALGKEQIVLEVSDDGIGLPEELDIEDPKSFGLNLVSLLTQQLRGDITLDRSAGARYHIRLRRAEMRNFLEPQSQ